MEEIKFKGCVSVPSVAAAFAGELAISLGFVPDGGELRRLKWKDFIDDSGTPGTTGTTGTSGTTETEVPGVPFPELEFGMVKAGTLVIADSFELPSSMVPASSASGAGAGSSTVHGTTSMEATNAQSAADVVAKRIRLAISNQVEARGCFYQPFLLRYALRMADGDHRCLSSPVLMLPWALPPCIALGASVSADDTSVVSLSDSSMRYFKLRCHVLNSLPEDWAAKVMGIDVYVTAPIFAYDREAVSTDGFVPFSQLVSSGFAGIWDESGTGYVQHTIDELGLTAAKAWCFTPNPMMKQEILDAKDFYHVAYIAASEWNEGNAIDLALPCTSAEALAKRPKLDIDNLDGHCAYKPAEALTYNSLTLGVGGSIEQPAPLPMRTMAQACGAKEEATAQICVLARRNGVEYATGCECKMRALPRYLFTAVPGAYALLIRMGVNTWRLPLTPHSSLSGAYWWGDLDQEIEIAEGKWQAFAEKAWYPVPNILMVFGDSYSALEIGMGQCFALRPALRAMSAGQFGSYPLYVFSTDGIWAVQWRDGTYGTPQLISHDQALSAKAIANMDSCIAYATAHGVKSLSGAKTENLGFSLAANPLIGMDLPHLEIAYEILGLNALSDATELHYDDGLLWVSDKGVAYVYNAESESWGMADDQGTALVVMRPIDGPVREVEIAGLMAEKPELYVYGSQDFTSWSLVASARAARIAISGSPWRYYAIVIRCDKAIALSKILIAQ